LRLVSSNQASGFVFYGGFDAGGNVVNKGKGVNLLKFLDSCVNTVILMLDFFRHFSLRRKYGPFFDARYYLDRYPDVALSGLHPLTHFIRYGEFERRRPSPWFFVHSVGFTHESARLSERPFLDFLESKGKAPPHPLIDPVKWGDFLSSLKKKGGGSLSIPNFNEICLDELKRDWWDPLSYLEQNPDLAGIEFPEDNFLEFGCEKELFVSPGIRVFSVDGSHWLMDGIPLIDKFSVHGFDYLVLRTSPDDTIINQVLNLSSLEPMILSVPSEFIPSMPTFRSTDLDSRDLIFVNRLEDFVASKPEALILVGDLTIGGAAKYAIDLSNSVARTLRTAIIATGVSHESLQTQVDAWGAQVRAIENPISFSSLARPHDRNAFTFALLVQRLKPAVVFIINSKLGYEAVKTFGKGMSNYTRIYSVFFSQSPKLIGRPHAARYLESCALVGNLLSDNRKFFDDQVQRLGITHNHIVRVVPPLASPPSDGDFEKTITHIAEKRRLGTNQRLLWVGRWDSHKDFKLIEKFASEFDQIEIDAYYSLPEGMKSPSSTIPNLRLIENSWDPGEIVFSNYSLFVFTSLYEGMPNTVLEVAGRGIPMVLADVGGLRETFDQETADFYAVKDDFVERYDSFQKAVLGSLASSWFVTESKIRAARKSVEANHSPIVFNANIDKLLSLAGEGRISW
jgi:glycosyltransferase involved in cell wall biosynthesis